jgi:hypothetical protein
MKKYNRGHLYASDDEVKTAVTLWFLHQDAQFYSDGFGKLLKRLLAKVFRLQR